MLEYLASAWREPDQGIWEMRGERQHFVHSKVMAWVAFDRAVDAAAAEGLNEEAARWREIADEIKAGGIVEQISPRHAARLLKKGASNRTACATG